MEVSNSWRKVLANQRYRLIQSLCAVLACMGIAGYPLHTFIPYNQQALVTIGAAGNLLAGVLQGLRHFHGIVC